MRASNSAPIQYFYREVPEGTSPGSTVITVRAVDADFGQNGEIEYSILNSKGLFFYVIQIVVVYVTNIGIIVLNGDFKPVNDQNMFNIIEHNRIE